MTEHIGSNGTLHDESPSFLILFASETGNAQDTAERIGLEAFKRGYKTRLMAMDAYPLVSAEQHRIATDLLNTTPSMPRTILWMSLWSFLCARLPVMERSLAI